MKAGTILAVLVLCAVVRAQAPEDALLEDARKAAVLYAKRLPDFLCAETIHRYEAYGSRREFRSIDTLTLQVSYFQMRESYKLVTRNNRPTKQKLESMAGAFSQGEFGSVLLSIFHPLSKARIEFKEWSVANGRRVGIFTYAVERVNSHFDLRVGARKTIAGYHGEIAIDAVTHMVLRIEQTIDVPEQFPLEYSRSVGEYDFVDVGGKQYLLPVRWESWSADLPGNRRVEDQKRYHNVIAFQDYRKYEAESKVSFDK